MFWRKAYLVIPGAIAMAAPLQVHASPIAGQWRTDDGRALVAISPCGDALCGRISRFLVPEPPGGVRDTENPKRSLRQRKLLGVQVFWNLKRVGDVWKGEGYSPEDGLYFNAELSPQGSRLKIRGCKLLFCKTKFWTMG